MNDEVLEHWGMKIRNPETKKSRHAYTGIATNRHRWGAFVCTTEAV